MWLCYCVKHGFIILDGDITYWDDNEIKAQNLNGSLPHQPIVVVQATQDEYVPHAIDLLQVVNPSFEFNGVAVTVDVTEEYLDLEVRCSW